MLTLLPTHDPRCIGCGASVDMPGATCQACQDEGLRRMLGVARANEYLRSVRDRAYRRDARNALLVVGLALLYFVGHAVVGIVKGTWP